MLMNINDYNDYYVQGFNFTHHDMDSLALPSMDRQKAEKILDVYIFGAGYNPDIHAKHLANKLLKAFPNIRVLYMHHDLMAASLATAGHEAGIIGILGTGSNACVYDGLKIQDKMEPLGYILGDEGGGFHIGKLLLNDYFNQRMPDKVSKDFALQYNLTKNDVLNHVYRSENAKSYVASFAGFLSDYRNSYTNMILSTVFDSFIKYLHPLHEKNPLPIYFVGSIAKIHEHKLLERLHERKLECKKILKDPMEELSNYILENPNNFNGKRY